MKMEVKEKLDKLDRLRWLLYSTYPSHNVHSTTCLCSILYVASDMGSTIYFHGKKPGK